MLIRNITEMNTFDKNLDGEGRNRRQGQEGKTVTIKYPEQWTLDDYKWFLCMESIYFRNTDYEYKRQTNEQEREDYDKMFEEMDQWSTKRLEKILKQTKHAGYELGPREFTLTYSPKWGVTDEQARQQMGLAITRLVKYYDNEIVRFIAIGEVGQNGQSHIHAFYELKGGRKITDKNFKRAYPRWNPSKKLGKGFEGGHHETVKSESDFLGYINKDITTAWFELRKIISQDIIITNEGTDPAPPQDYETDDSEESTESDY